MKRKRHFLIRTALALFMVLCSVWGWGQTFTQITSLANLTSGEYLIVGDGTNDGMMINTINSGPIINYSAVSNPGATITSGFTNDNIFTVTVTGTTTKTITIYHASVGYVSWGNTGTGTSNHAGFYNSAPTNKEEWSATVAASLWTLANVATPARIFQWNSGSPRFAAYTSAQTKLKLYKKEASSPCDPLSLTAGTTNATSTQVASGGSTNLSLTGTSTGDGLSYQWQSSADSSSWTNISGATNATYTATNITASTYYRAAVTCGSTTAYSTPVHIIISYCTAGATEQVAEKISNFTFGSINNNSTASTGYEDFTSLSTDAQKGVALPFSVNVNDPYAQDQILIWVDLNQDYEFDDVSERVYTGTITGIYPVSGNITIPNTALNGNTRLRIRLFDTESNATANACGDTQYGQVEDYTVNILPSSPTILADGNSLSIFTYVEGNGPSAEQSFTVTGANLSSNITATAPTNWEVSATSGSGFGTTATLPAAGGTVYTRLVSGLAVNPSYTGNIALTSTGATPVDVAVSGSVTPMPAVPSVTASSQAGTVGTAFNYQVNATENPDTYTLASGTLPGGLNLDASTGIISGTPTSAGIFTANITATNTGGTSAPAAIEITIGKGTQTATLNDINATVGASAITLPATTDAGLTIMYSSNNTTVADVTGNTLTIGSAGSATITATVAETADYFAFTDAFTVTVNTAIVYTKISSLSELSDGEYVVVSNGTNAMNNTVSSNKLQTTLVTVNSNSIINPDDTIIWIIETDNANVKTLRNKASSTFVSGGGSNTSITLVPTVSGNGQKWEASIVNSLFRLTNQSQTSRALIYNGSVFGQYAVSNVDGLTYFDLELYKKEPAPASTTYAGGSWTNGAPNSPDTDAVISENYNGAGFTAKDITVSSGAALTITSTETITAANITVEDNANFIQEDGSTLTLTGTMTLNKNATSDATKYVFWSSPVQNQNVYDIYPAGTPQFVMTYNSDTDLYPTVANPTIAAAGVGYSVKVPVSATAAQFTGAPNSGDIPVSLDHAANANGNTWNLIGNPYPSNLNLQSLYNGGGIGSSIYFWDNISATNTTQQQAATTWAVYNAANGTWSNTGNAGLGIDGNNNLVKPGQGFIVQATAPSITFTNAMRSAATANFINKGMNPGEGKFWLKLTTPSGTQFQTAITYGGGALNTLEAFDSKVMSVGANGVYSYLGADKLAIQGRDYFVNTDVVILGNKHSASGQYTFSLAGKTGLFDAGQAIYLKDKQTNIYTNLQTDSYTFLSDALEQQDRFEIVYQPQAALGTAETVKTETVVYKDGDHFTVKASEKILSIEVYDASGRHIGTVKPDSTTAQVTAGSRGMYLLKIKTVNSETVKKVIK